MRSRWSATTATSTRRPTSTRSPSRSSRPRTRPKRSTRASSPASSTSAASRRRSSRRPRPRSSRRAASSPTSPTASTTCWSTSVNPPLNKADARKAISLAIDRDAIIEGVFKGFQTKATSIIPPPMKAYYQAGVCDVCDKPDIPRAKDLAAKAGHPAGHQGQPGLQHRRRARSLGPGRPAAAGDEPRSEGRAAAASPFAELLQEGSGPERQRPVPGGLERRLPERRELPLPAAGQGFAAARRQPGPVREPEFEDSLAAARRTTDEATPGTNIKAAEKQAIGDDLALIPLWYREPVPGLRLGQVDRRQARLLREPHPGHHQPQVVTSLFRWADTSSGGCCR